MKFFKVEADRKADKYEITLKNFQRATERKQPFEQINNQGGFSQYAICPSCLNPIQIIGLMYKTKVNPYGRHTGKDIEGFNKWNYNRYRFCPYSVKGDYITPNDNDLLEIDKDVIDLYNLLRDEFDKVVYLVSKTLNIRFSKLFWKDALGRYLGDHTYCYPWLTESNLPYIFAYRGLHQQNIYGQKFLIDSPLYNALKAHSNVKFVEDEKDKNYAVLLSRSEYLDVQFRFSEHNQKAVEGQALQESIMFYVDDMSNNRTIFQEKIVFDETYFINLIRKENKEYRQQWLLDIANELMTGIQIDEN